MERLSPQSIDRWNAVERAGIELLTVSADTSRILDKLFTRYCEVYRDVEARAEVQVKRVAAHPKMTSFQFVDADTVREANSLPNCFRMRGKYGDRAVKLVVKTARPDVDTFVPLLRQALSILWLYGRQVKSSNITIYDTALTKHLPRTAGEAIGARHVNSGATFTYSTQPSQVVIWRREEMTKVLAHEVVHSLQLDAPRISKKLEHKFFDIFRISANRPLLPNEAYVESVANILNCFYISLATGASLQRSLDVERRFAVYSTARVLAHYGFDDPSQLLRSVPTATPDIQQDTSVFSYYVLRAALLFNVDAFIAFGGQAETFPCFPSRTGAAAEFVNLAASAASSTSFIAAVRVAMRSQSKIGGGVTTTLRMTALELHM